ncbi:MAG: hypothetical protein ACLQF4_04560 [Xanthobacteraceae bacterium]
MDIQSPEWRIWQIRRLIFDFWQALAFLRATSRLAMSSSGKVTRRTGIVHYSDGLTPDVSKVVV